MSATILDAPRELTPASSALGSAALRRALWLVGSTTFLGQIIGVATSVSLRWLLDPAQLGLWQTGRLFASYGNYLNLGASKGAARELSLAHGRGAADNLRHEIAVAQTLNVVTALGYGVVLAILSLFLFDDSSGSTLAITYHAALFLALFVVLQRLVTFQITLLRAEQRFDITSRQSLGEGVATLVVAGGATWLGGLPGLAGATLLVGLGSLVYLHRHARFGWQWAWDRATCRRLIAVGGPILLAGWCTTLFRSLDRLALIFGSADFEFEMGCYSTALLVGNQLYGLASVAGTVTAPQLTILQGATADDGAVARAAARTTLWQSCWLAPLGALTVIGAPPLLAMLFPAYRAGLTTLPWVIGALVSTLAQPATNALIAGGRERRALVLLVVSTLATAAMLLASASAGVTMLGVSIIACIGQTLYAVSALHYGIAARLTTDQRQSFYAAHALAWGPPLLLVVMLELFTPQDHVTAEHWPSLLLKFAASALLLSGWTWLMRQRIELSFGKDAEL